MEMQQPNQPKNNILAGTNASISTQPHEEPNILYFRPIRHLDDRSTDTTNVQAIDTNILVVQDTLVAKQFLSKNNIEIAIAACHTIDSEILQELKEVFSFNEDVLWIMLIPKTHVNNPAVSSLISTYCYDYHTYPVDINRLGIILGHALGMRKLRSKTHTNEEAGHPDIIGSSELIQQLLRKAKKTAKVEAPLLLTGESGTGKELIAREIHKYSSRAKGPFIAVNCAALPASLVQSELFGHEKGSFTGAQSRRIGRFEMANEGTIFLDEIGDLPLEMQVILLRTLETKTMERLGSTETRQVNARVIAATHVNLRDAIIKGEFREDLYYRLNVIPLKVPALRERGSRDIIQIANYYLDKYTKDNELQKKKFGKSAIELMSLYNWPGNVRELMNAVRNAAIMSENKTITPDDLGLERRSSERKLLTLKESKETAERNAIMTALSHTNNNISLAANALGTSRTSLYRLIVKHKIQQLKM